MTNHLVEYLSTSRDEEPAQGAVGVESQWLDVATLNLASGLLWIGDPQFSWAEANEEDGCLIQVPAGTYRVQARGLDYAGVRVTGRVRVVREGVDEPELADEIGDAGTDSGQIGIGDQPHLRAAFAAAFGDDVDAALDHLEAGITGAVGVYRPTAEHDGCVVYLPSGFGDGGGPVLELLADGERVGVEHEFVPAGEPY